MDKEYARTDGPWKQRDGNIKKEPKSHVKDQKQFMEMKNAFDGLISRLDMAKERILNLRTYQLKLQMLKREPRQK